MGQVFKCGCPMREPVYIGILGDMGQMDMVLLDVRKVKYRYMLHCTIFLWRDFNCMSICPICPMLKLRKSVAHALAPSQILQNPC